MYQKYTQTNNQDDSDVRTGTDGTQGPRTHGDIGWSFECSVSTLGTRLQCATLTSNDTLIVGSAIWLQTRGFISDPAVWPYFDFRSTTNTCAKLICHHGSFFVVDAQDNYVAGSRTTFDTWDWHYVEMKVYSHSTNGTIEVRVNGVPVIDVSSVNTEATEGKATRIVFGSPSASGGSQYIRYDDVYICDGTGNTNNDFLGDVAVRTLIPDGDDTTQFANTGNVSKSTHYEEVNMLEASFSTDWVSDSTSGNRDIFTFNNATETYDEIYGVVGWTYAQYETSAETYRMVCDSNGTEEESTNITANSSWKNDLFILEEDPDTSNSWNQSSINAIKFGFELQ
jgi:hypothetical protein